MARGIRVGKERVRGTMQEHGIKARGKRESLLSPLTASTVGPLHRTCCNATSRPVHHQVWTGDITYIATDEGWLYLAVVLGLFSRQVVGSGMQTHMQSSRATDAPRMAWLRRAPDAGVIFHSDRGSQYCGHEFQ